MTIDVHELTTDEEWAEAVPVLRQLWSHKSEDEVRSWREEDDYTLLGLYDDGDLVGCAGLYLQVVLHHERTAWLHDLVIDEDHRSEGYGATLLDAAREWGADQECDTLALVSRTTNDEAAAFYEREDMDRFGSVYEYRD